jgi:hypothetical protein
MGEKHVIVFTGDASFDKDVPRAGKIPAYLEKYGPGIRSLNSTPEEFGREYSKAIRIKPTEVRGWV